MKITYVERNCDATEDLKLLAEKKLAKLDKFFKDDAKATVTFKKRKTTECIEITVSSVGILCRAEEENSTFNNALDAAEEKLERQLRKHKTKLAKRLREDVFEKGEITEEEEPEAYDVREKTFRFVPMSIDDAIMQMNLIDHDFFVFLNEYDGKVNVVYKRKNGDYGLIKQE